MMTLEQRNNCEKLATVIAGLPEGQCNMQHWVTDATLLTDGTMYHLPPIEQRGKPGCGTAACMGGWAVTVLTPALRTYGGTVVLPVEWAMKHDLYSRSYYDNITDPIPTAGYSIKEVGRVVLGDPIADQFLYMDYPKYRGMTDKEWMLDRLRDAVHRFDAGEYSMVSDDSSYE